MTLKQLQHQLAEEDNAAVLLTHNNMFLNEDILPEENKILELTGFSGSAGTLLVTPSQAYLMVDGRYTIQAALETSAAEVTVVGFTHTAMQEIIELCRQLNIKTLIYNPWCLSMLDARYLKENGITLTAREDLIGNVISPKPVAVFEHEIKYAGLSTPEKINNVIQKIPHTFAAMLICAADQVSWLANLRSDALPDTPIVRAFALLDRNGQLTLFAPNTDYPGIQPLTALPEYLARYAGKCIMIDPAQTPQKILDLLPSDVKHNSGFNALTAQKSAKNPVEMQGFINAHIRDGIAVTKFLYWLEHNYKGKTELDIVAKLRHFREQQDLFYSDSFGTIAAAGANAAIVHYQPTNRNNSPLPENSVLLLDSGAQYYDGTTDVTRTIALGSPSTEIKESFTQVLKAHIHVASQQFPQNTKGELLDGICRAVLWQYGKNYAHGTGHSVGHFSNVHESPFGLRINGFVAKENYITSIEPGYYKEGAYGIRIENMVRIVKAEDSDYLKFKNLTVIPIDKRLIDTYLLTSGERAWLNSYHQEVFGCLAPYMDTAEREWLKAACAPL